MTADFDPLKAVKEEIAGLSEVLRSISARERIAEEAIGRAEKELNDIRKITGFVRIEIDRKREVLRKLEEAST